MSKARESSPKLRGFAERLQAGVVPTDPETALLTAPPPAMAPQPLAAVRKVEQAVTPPAPRTVVVERKGPGGRILLLMLGAGVLFSGPWWPMALAVVGVALAVWKAVDLWMR